MKIQASVALVTGANRGLGQAIVRRLLAAGVSKVYATARDVSKLPELPGVIPLALDVTDPHSVAAAAAQAQDVNLLINNAGIALAGGFLAEDAAERARRELETNYFGPLATSQAFAPILARNGGGALVNVLSVLSWINSEMVASYSASKSAAWSLTNGLREELRSQGTLVVGVHVGPIDTEMSASIPMAKIAPEEVARQILAAVEAGEEEVLADEMTRQVKAALSEGVYLHPNR